MKTFKLNMETQGKVVLAEPSPKYIGIKEPNKEIITTFMPGTLWTVVTVNPPDSCALTPRYLNFFVDGPTRPKQTWDDYSMELKYKRLKKAIYRLIQGKHIYYEMHFEVSHCLPVGRLHCHMLVHWKDHIFQSEFHTKLTSIMQNGVPSYEKKTLISIKHHAVNVYLCKSSYFSSDTTNIESYAYLWKEDAISRRHKLYPCTSTRRKKK